VVQEGQPRLRGRQDVPLRRSDRASAQVQIERPPKLGQGWLGEKEESEPDLPVLLQWLNGEEEVHFLMSKWYNGYDPVLSEKMKDKPITDNEIKNEEFVRECDKEDCPMFILTKDCLNSGTWKQFFVDGRDEGKSLTSDGINNWDEVVDNINDPKLKQRAIDTNTLYGDEYPDETHIVFGVLKITSEEMEELCYSLMSDSQEKGEKR